MKNDVKFVVLHETIFQSWVSDAGTYAMFVALVGTGWALESTALQWVGAIMGFLAVVGHACGKTEKLTFEQARSRIDEIEASLTRTAE